VLLFFFLIGNLLIPIFAVLIAAIFIIYSIFVSLNAAAECYKYGVSNAFRLVFRNIYEFDISTSSFIFSYQHSTYLIIFCLFKDCDRDHNILPVQQYNNTNKPNKRKVIENKISDSNAVNPNVNVIGMEIAANKLDS